MAGLVFPCCTCHHVDVPACTCAGCITVSVMTRSHYCNAECAQISALQKACACTPRTIMEKDNYCVQWRRYLEATNYCRVCQHAQCNQCLATDVMLTLADGSKICVECAEEVLNEHFKRK